MRKYGHSEMKALLKQTNLYLKYREIKDNKNYKKYLQIFNAIKEVRDSLVARGCHFMFVLPPNNSRIEGLSEFENYRIKNWTFDFNDIREKDAILIQKIYKAESLQYIQSVYEGAKVLDRNGHKVVADYSSRYVNISSGIRRTVHQPLKWHNRIHIYGACTVRGTGVEDKHTIASFLQELINADHEDSYQCVNHGIGCGSNILDDLYQIENTPLYQGDMIILCNLCSEMVELLMKKNDIPVYDSSPCFSRPHPYDEWFTDVTPHTNRIGNQVIAKFIMDSLEDLKWLEKEKHRDQKLLGCLKADMGIDDEWVQSESFIEYVKYLKNECQDRTINNGAIVMNCNPFTLGHRYLIDAASKEVDTLYVFVVEEDKSFFKFEDRFQLVKDGTRDITNVKVLKSGHFIISAVTFPGYFYKDHDQEAIVDTSKDIDLFGRYIAPELGIKVRFAGEEPLDHITRQYNETMAERLPMHGIRFCEIKRKTDGSRVISASRVRAAMQADDWDIVRILVPDTTYTYLIENYKKG